MSEECSQEKLDKQIAELKERVIDEKKKAGGNDKIENYMKSCEKQKKVLENRLHLVSLLKSTVNYLLRSKQYLNTRKFIVLN